jgi:DNA repair protein RecO (recombination protein O)
MTAHRRQAIVLRRTNYGEADRILQLITPEGRLDAVARGVRREKSKLAGGIELFAVCDVVVHESKRGGLGILTSARLVHFYRHILEDYDAMQFAYEATKHVARATESLDEADWFDVLVGVFSGLDSPDIPRQLVETWFYLRIATLLGTELSLSFDIQGQPLREDDRYVYDVAEKGLRQDQRGELTRNHITLLRVMNAHPIQTAAQLGGVQGILSDCWQVARRHAAL